MSNRSIGLDAALQDYILRETIREPELLAELRAETAKLPRPGLQIAPEQGRFMALLAQLTGARRYLEIGTFTGYSALCIALAMPADSHTLACDISKEWTDIARRYWQRAGVAERMELRLAPAQETLDALLAEGQASSFDLAFIDADKAGYQAYLERCLELVRPGGLIMIDNTLWSGKLVDERIQDEDTVSMRDFNRRLRERSDVEVAMVPVGDGLTLVWRPA